MSEMRVAYVAQNFGAYHAMTAIDVLTDIGGIERLEVARPAATGVELGVGLEQRRAAADAGVDAVLVVVDVFAGARRFGCRVARHAVLHRREQLLPLGIGLDDFVHAETFGGDGVGPGTLPRAAGSKHASGYCRLSIALGINAFCGPAA